jgi:hypothetical protein
MEQEEVSISKTQGREQASFVTSMLAERENKSCLKDACKN